MLIVAVGAIAIAASSTGIAHACVLEPGVVCESSTITGVRPSPAGRSAPAIAEVRSVGASGNWNIYEGPSPVGYLCGTALRWQNRFGQPQKLSIEATRGTATAKVYMRFMFMEGAPFYKSHALLKFSDGAAIPVVTDQSAFLEVITFTDPSRFYRELRLSPSMIIAVVNDERDPVINLAGLPAAMDAVKHCMSR